MKNLQTIESIALLLLGFLFHYLYSFFGESRIAAFFFPVNESVWEHLKLGYWAVFVISVAGYVPLKNRANNYFLSRLLGVLALEASILTIFYTYTTLVGHNIPWVDISSYAVGVVACQYFSFYLFRFKSLSGFGEAIGLLAFVGIGILLGVSTYHPPHAGIFMDKNTQSYGISREK